MNLPRLMIAGTGGDSGKTLVALGLSTLWRREGIEVKPFKKGPDYIDPAWLSLATGHPTYNLDSWMMGEERVRRSFAQHSVCDGINLIESNRGLHDGENAEGTHSSANLAKLLDTPVVLVLPVRKVTRTAAAFVLGIQQLDPDVTIAGVILNLVGGERHRSVTTRAIEEITGLPVLGAIRRLKSDPLPGRHLGIILPDEHLQAEKALDIVADLLSDSVDTELLAEIARKVNPLSVPVADETGVFRKAKSTVKIGYFTGSAFTFYYPDNLEALRAAGAELIEVNPESDQELPECDALYIGGGFPEIHAVELTSNRTLHASLRSAVETGLPVWAECGGLMYLSRSIRWKGKRHAMSGVLSVDIEVMTKPQGHGYEMVEIDVNNPFLDINTKVRGHEFHYSRIVSEDEIKTSMSVQRGTGIGSGRDGIVYKNVMASYLHVHAVATPEWVEGMIRAASVHRDSK